MIDTIVIVISMFFIIIGALLTVISAIGLIRLPDVYTRAHAASKSSTLGVMFMMFGVFLYFLGRAHHFEPTLILAILFIFSTGPIGAHLIMRSAYYSGTAYTNSTVRDDLKNAE